MINTVYLKNMEISKIINSQKHFFNTNKTKDVRFRIETLKKLKNILKENEKNVSNCRAILLLLNIAYLD